MKATHAERDAGFEVVLAAVKGAAMTPRDYIAHDQDGAQVLNTGLAATLAIDALIAAGWTPPREG